MALVSGTRFGPYEVRSALGAGGMGEVYRARDGKLQRDVALKVLPASVAADPDRLARFEREAQALAALNHPHIGAIYGLQESESATALVLELVEGPTLADRIAQGPVPLDEALPIARQIAEALEAAHEAGIIHRDLKPANIKLRPDGAVKVLDFGLAKAVDPASGSGLAATNLANSPTLTARGTEAGMILGTAAYMAPEQARGKPVDKRADIWAFGVVVWEMLAGRRLFDGETVSDTLAAVLTKHIDWTPIPATTPAPVRQLLGRCLDRDPTRRLRDIGEARVLLANLSAVEIGPSPAAGSVSRAGIDRWLRRITGTLGVVVVVLGVSLWRRPTERHEPAVYDIAAPPRTILSIVNRPALSLSPSGDLIAFAAMQEGTPYVYVRSRADGAARRLEGTEGASEPSISPDGQWVAFIADTHLRRVPSTGGPVSDIMTVNDPRGFAWRDASTLVVAPAAVSNLVAVAATGGTPTPVTTLDPKNGERTHRWPQVLPGGKAVIFTVGTFANPDDYDGATIDAVDLTTNARKTLITGARMARYIGTGHLLFARQGVLHAVRFDPDRLQLIGASKPVINGLGGDKTTGSSHFTYAGDGTLAYIPGEQQGGLRRLVWTDLKGTISPGPEVPQAGIGDPSLSPDGRRLAVTLQAGNGVDIWTYDFERRTFTRLTFSGVNMTPVWSATGDEVWYTSIASTGQQTTVYRKPADGGRDAERVIEIPHRAYLRALLPERGQLLMDVMSRDSQSDVALVPYPSSGDPVLLVATTADELTGALSPDHRFVAYGSDESNRYEVFVRDLSTAGARWQISTLGGEEPHWSYDGKTLYFRNGSRMMAVDVMTRGTVHFSAPRVLFDNGFELRTDTARTYDVDRALPRLLMIRPANEAEGPPSVRVVLHWDEELARLMATP